MLHYVMMQMVYLYIHRRSGWRWQGTSARQGEWERAADCNRPQQPAEHTQRQGQAMHRWIHMQRQGQPMHRWIHTQRQGQAMHRLIHTQRQGQPMHRLIHTVIHKSSLHYILRWNNSTKTRKPKTWKTCLFQHMAEERPAWTPKNVNWTKFIFLYRLLHHSLQCTE